MADVLAKQPALMKRLFGYVLRLVGNESKAEDICQDVLLIAIEGKRYPWDGVTEPMKHLGSIANSRISNDRTRAANRREKLKRAEEDDDPDKRDSRPSPISLAAAEQHEERRVALAADVMRRLQEKEDHIAIGTLQLTQQGRKSAEEQAVELRCTVKDIYRARERVAYLRETVIAEAQARGEWP
jgi:DNA-directed RNA polymerase specialized sigma24 family protein